ncbi:V protein [Phyllostomus bat morbillivirus]|uniref:Non-structural protein V n=1 Tax=Phyllostomus bat morbillivirus TaxID=2853285 RepID=A0AAE9HUU2_9MONO|nr:V protein [Phyllostomus bat morbillivirus]
MAEEQAQHVSKGLECIKAIRANPLCIEEIQEISIIRDTALEEFEPPVSSEQDEEDLDEDINESQKAAGGPAGQSTLCPNSDGFGEADGQDFGRTDVERHEPVSRSDIQCYYVHSHCGEEVEGIQDVDSVLVQSDNNCNPDDSEGTDSADEGASGFSKDDSSKSTANDRGSTSTPVPIRSADVSKMMEDEITSLLGPDNRNKGRENLGRQLTFPKQPKIAETGSDLESIKKGHRREINLIWNGDRLYIDKWCNPMCAKITSDFVRAQCTCGECPQICSECKDDTEMRTRVWYASSASSTFQ